MLNEVEQFIRNYIVNKEITLDDIAIYGDKKIEVVLSKENYMASISITPNFEYDFLAVTIEDESIVINITEQLSNLQYLLERVSQDLQHFNNLSTNLN